ncbi:MAG: ABC transporter permease [Verrucomicrobiaceae bacterium]|nr:ABC transporter permease [Verrucomicrobiaceae bacterium]
MVLLVVLPFLTNFLIRVFAWKSLLHPDGMVCRGLIAMGLMTEEQQLLYNAGAVVVVMFYVQLPFAILPLYAAAEKFDFGLLDAARDLGAGAARAFWEVFIPGVRGGLVAASLMVFISGVGQYVIPQIVGGVDTEMIGNKIAQRVFSDRNLPEASALSSMLLLGVLALMIANSLRRRLMAKEGPGV